MNVGASGASSGAAGGGGGVSARKANITNRGNTWILWKDMFLLLVMDQLGHNISELVPKDIS